LIFPFPQRESIERERACKIAEVKMETEGDAKRRREVESGILEKVGQIISEIKSAKHVDQLICSLHSLALLLFPLDSSLILPTIDESFREQVTVH